MQTWMQFAETHELLLQTHEPLGWWPCVALNCVVFPLLTVTLLDHQKVTIVYLIGKLSMIRFWSSRTSDWFLLKWSDTGDTVSCAINVVGQVHLLHRACMVEDEIAPLKDYMLIYICKVRGTFPVGKWSAVAKNRKQDRRESTDRGIRHIQEGREIYTL